MVRKLLCVVILFETIGFFYAVLLHLGFNLFGYSEILNTSEAAIQGLITLIFVTTLGGLLLKKRWSWTLALISHSIAVIGAMFGIFATVKNGLPLNYNFLNSLRLLLLLIVLIILLIPRVKKLLI